MKHLIQVLMVLNAKKMSCDCSSFFACHACGLKQVFNNSHKKKIIMNTLKLPISTLILVMMPVVIVVTVDIGAEKIGHYINVIITSMVQTRQP